jgi:uncharacterized OsmC-like protein
MPRSVSWCAQSRDSKATFNNNLMQTWHYTFEPHAPQTQVLCGFLNRPTAATVEDGFKNTQGPIKARYAGEAKEALLTLKATGTADDSAVVCKVETGRGLAVAGIHPKCGGSGLELCSGDMLLEALIACAGVSMRAAAAVLDIPVGSIKVSAEGDVDLRGTLGVSDDVPVGFKEIRLAFDVDADASLAQLDQLAELTDKYCVVFQTIQNSPKTSVRVTRKV